MSKYTRISIRISTTTWELLEKHGRLTGVESSHLVEQAILHHLQALEELPVEYIVHPRMVVSSKTAEEVLGRAETAEPTPSLRELMRDGDPGGAAHATLA